ncbi:MULTISPECIES: LysR family transcriptional regulator [Pseudomonas]|uniref:Transcriptional regulator n=2 Tax=Pseudomonas syringae group genomosp. 2 TaxID=251698 RepID=A0AAX1VLG5_PSEAJ|nr:MULTISPECIES: LysR family transcriptional regulator [Pseudomonas syringae group genomosp. 2]KPY83475.1 Transcriptional regulator [Pseudomonas amygdali pv. tabaci]RML74814.1 Transcriptional regulator [Pseudomonas amygdali pv. tabaci]RMR84475.1 Transcriptional regulator [Pseudomonas amygdali pv. tabaci]RMV75907.1 Transcriptional regulator [Pseudomonas amygdali pv. sesami]BCS41844.1 hypothetical protein Pta6605_01750 [Pseudomonas amygdali pv. tabaci]
MRPVNFDLDVMRSFVTGVELGSFAKAAQKLARSTSAISAQLKKLEAQAGSPLFKKAGRKLALTDTGEVLLNYSKRLLSLNDETITAVSELKLKGWVRLGFRKTWAVSCRQCLDDSPEPTPMFESRHVLHVMQIC